MKLEISLMPRGSWGKSLAQLLDFKVWGELRREVYKRFNHSCGICGVSNKVLHCHEVWEFQEKKKLQVLRGFIAICEDCHSIIHFGFTLKEIEKGKKTRSELKRLVDHFCKVNGVTEDVFNKHQREAFETYRRQSEIKFIIVWGKFSPVNVTKVYTKMLKDKERKK